MTLSPKIRRRHARRTVARAVYALCTVVSTLADTGAAFWNLEPMRANWRVTCGERKVGRMSAGLESPSGALGGESRRAGTPDGAVAGLERQPNARDAHLSDGLT